jgi:hypothetical protein
MQEVASAGVVEPLPPPTEIEGLANAWMSHDGFREKIGNEMPTFSVARMVGFSPGRSKMLDLWIDPPSDWLAGR